MIEHALERSCHRCRRWRLICSSAAHRRSCAPGGKPTGRRRLSRWALPSGQPTRRPRRRRRVAGVGLVWRGGAERRGLPVRPWPWLSAVLAWRRLPANGLSTYRKGWLALRQRTPEHQCADDVAVTGAVIGQWPEAAMVIMFVCAGRAHRGALAGARPRRHQQPDGGDAGLTAWRTNRRRPMAAMPGQQAERRQRAARAARRTGGAGCRHHRRARRRWTNRQSPAKACRWIKPSATRCLPAA